MLVWYGIYESCPLLRHLDRTVLLSQSHLFWVGALCPRNVKSMAGKESENLFGAFAEAISTKARQEF